MEVQRIGFTKLMNLDSGTNIHDPETYYSLRNGRVINKKSISLGNIIPEVGNTKVFNFPSFINYESSTIYLSNIVILGIFNFGDYLLIYTTVPNSVNDQIWKVKYDIVNNKIWNSDETLLLAQGSSLESNHLIYNGDFSFSVDHKIQMIYNYESPKIQKVYWIDGLNELRNLNLASSLAEIRAMSIDDFTILPNNTLSRIMPLETNSSGIYVSGKVQYSYQLYNQGGQETTFAPLSPLVPLSESSDIGISNGTFTGTAKGELTGKSVTIRVDDIDTDFDYIRIIAIFYQDLDETPEIRVIYDNNISASSVTIVDSGTVTLGVFTPLEVNDIGSVILKPNMISQKDNMLFVGAASEEEHFDISDYDFDARAYRWKNNSFKIDGVTHDSSYLTSVSEDSDCVLTYDEQYDYKYIQNGTTMGAEGRFIKIEFSLQDIIIDADYTNELACYPGTQEYNWESLLGDQFINTNGFADYSHSMINAYLTGYQRDELYALAIVVRDKRGRRSYPQWICDLKMPSMAETNPTPTFTYIYNGSTLSGYNYPITYNNTDDNTVHGLILGLKVTLKSNPFGTDISGWEIVRMRRNPYDRRVFGQGLLTYCMKDNLTNAYRSAQQLLQDLNTGAGGARIGDVQSVSGNYYKLRDAYLRDFTSPDIIFRPQDYQFKAGDYLKAEFTYGYEHTRNTPIGMTTDILKLSGHNVISYGHAEDIQIEDVLYHKNSSSEEYSFAGISFKNYTFSTIAGDFASKKNSSLIIKSPANTITLNPSYYDNNRFLMCSYRRILDGQYGGNSYSLRSTRSYIGTNSYTTDLTNTPKYVFGGDVYVTMYDYMRVSPRGDGNGTKRVHSEVVFFPVETTINIPYRHDNCFSKLDSSAANERFLLQEFAGDYGSIGDGTYGDYVQDYDLNLMNSAYLQNSTLIVYPAESIFATNINTFYARVRRSEIKTHGEFSDSWLRFLTENKLDLDSNRGVLTALYNFKDRLFFLQEHALGIIPVNDRAILSTGATNETLLLGNTGLMNDYVYISNISGTIHRDSLVEGTNGLYYYDSYNNNLMCYTGENIYSLSTVKGISSWLHENLNGEIKNTNNLTNSSNRFGVSSGYDSINNRVIFTFYDTDFSDTVSYNEFANSFESFYDFRSPHYLNHNGSFLSVSPDSSVYIHGQGNNGNFYGTVHDTEITLLCNPSPEINKVFHNIFYSMDTINSGLDINYTFYKYRAWNSYQDTGNITLTVTDNIVRKSKIREWKMTAGRNIDNSRLSDYYLFIKYSFNNSYNYDFKFKNLLMFYDKAVR